jgi:hypothetical protein
MSRSYATVAIHDGSSSRQQEAELLNLSVHDRWVVKRGELESYSPDPIPLRRRQLAARSRRVDRETLHPAGIPGCFQRSCEERYKENRERAEEGWQTRHWDFLGYLAKR